MFIIVKATSQPKVSHDGTLQQKILEIFLFVPPFTNNFNSVPLIVREARPEHLYHFSLILSILKYILGSRQCKVENECSKLKITLFLFSTKINLNT